MACVREVHPSTARVGLIQSVNDEFNTVRVLIRWAIDPWTRFHLDPQLQCIPPHWGSRWSPTWDPFSRLLWPGRLLLEGLARSRVSPTLPRGLPISSRTPLPRSGANSASPPPREVAGLVTVGVERVVVEEVGVT